MRILRCKQACEKTGESRSAFYSGVRTGRWPKPIELGPRSVGWIDEELEEAIRRRIEERDAKAGAAQDEAAKRANITNVAQGCGS